MSDKRRYRCAIYTRKSHEEGLDQDFNSLDAQRESCEAYILSQAGLGWELTDRVYEDGGISGGHMERDGLQALLCDIKAGQIDVVVVYKVDRLTRSITDFGKLVEVFDTHDVSFVSVTQAFNTTNSMGRLTLNVLLSFAQFEREVTAERIRDKIASSKQKGMWMGGRVPFGYRNENRQLLIDDKEAAIVRQMFDLYLEHQNMRLVKRELDRQGIVSRKTTNRYGGVKGGIPFSRGNIGSILRNPVYAGLIKHKDNIYAGNHDAIVQEEQWEQVQSLLSENVKHHTRIKKQASPALLNGLLFDSNNNPLICHYAKKQGKRYYYYVSKANENLSNNQSKMRLPIQMIEQIVIDLLNCTLSDEAALVNCLNTPELSVEQISRIGRYGKELASELQTTQPASLKALLQSLIREIKIEDDQIVLRLCSESLLRRIDSTFSEKHCHQTVTITKDITIRKRGQEMKLVLGGIEPKPENKDLKLIKLVAKAHLLRTELESQVVDSIKTFAAKYKLDHADAKNLIPLSYLAPTIIEDILAGHQPVDLNVKKLKSLAKQLPLNWSEQREVLGFAS